MEFSVVDNQINYTVIESAYKVELFLIQTRELLFQAGVLNLISHLNWSILFEIWLFLEVFILKFD